MCWKKTVSSFNFTNTKKIARILAFDKTLLYLCTINIFKRNSMNLKEQIASDFMIAYKAKEMEKKNFLGVLKGAIQTQEGKQIPSTDENVLKVIKSMEKGLNETIEGLDKMNQDSSIQKLELSYLKAYIPAQMSEDEITSFVLEILNRPNTNKNIGALMGTFNKEHQGKSFDNKMVSKIIQQNL